MGKKSKRSRKAGSSSTTTTTATTNDAAPRRSPPSLRQPNNKHDEETKDNLQFQDPFPDEYDPDNEGDDDMVLPTEEDYDNDNPEENSDKVQVWNPWTGDTSQPLEMDESAYKMHHALTAEWPSLTFDFVKDDLGESRTRFPHSLMAVAGTQADRPERNQLILMKLSDLGRIQVETEDDILGEEYNPDQQNDHDDDDDDDSDDEIDLDPVLEHYSLPHYGGVNRLRVMPQQTQVVASWSDVGKVYLYNISTLVDRCSGHKTSSSFTSSSKKEGPFFTYNGHAKVEGFAMDWSKVTAGQLATGDCHGNIHLWQQHESTFQVTPSYEVHPDKNVEQASVEDLQWSPTEATVLSAAECGGHVRIYDSRAPHRAMLGHQIHKNGADVNVLSWNALVANLLATGGDDGTLSVWDLRNFQPDTPLARFTSHKTPITSLEWHPTDESMLALSDDVGTYIYDLSIEEDNDDAAAANKNDLDIPPQLLFVHCGSEQTKEVHWHPQISSCIMTTALSGFSTFIPSNL